MGNIRGLPEAAVARRDDIKDRVYPKELGERHLEVVRLLHEHGDLTERELADLMGLLRSAPYVQTLKDNGVRIRKIDTDRGEAYVLDEIAGLPAADLLAPSAKAKQKFKVVAGGKK